MSRAQPSRPVPAHRSGPQMFRLVTIAAVAAVAALSAFADRSGTAKPPSLPVAAMPVAAPAAAVSSSWFCAGATASPPRLADGRLVIANAAGRPLSARVTLVPSTGAPVSRPVQVGPADRVVVAETVANPAPFVGAVVELDGGQATVQQVIAGTEGTSSTACATAGATSWYFPSGTTQESATLSMELLNPYPDDAIADLSFTTEQGQENPQDFQGLVIPAGTVAGFDLGSHLRRRAAVAATVTLRVGRVVAFETQTVQPQSPAAAATQAPGTRPWPPGVSVVRGAPSTGTSWWWPSGGVLDGVSEQYVIYNPGAAQARVSLAVDLDQGSADPFQVNVDPHAVAVVATNGESRVPKGIGHAAALRSTNGVGVVADRLLLASAPAAQTGVAQVLGSALQAGAWLEPGIGASDGVNPALVVYNPGPAPVSVAISSLNGVGGSAPVGQGSVVVAAGHRYVLAPSPATPVLVTAGGPGQVVVEADTSPAHGLGVDAAIGVPLAP